MALKRYQVSGQVTVSCITRIWARSEAEALELAKELKDHVYVITDKAPSGYNWEDGFFVADGDGVVQEMKAEEVDPNDENEE